MKNTNTNSETETETETNASNSSDQSSQSSSFSLRDTMEVWEVMIAEAGQLGQMTKDPLDIMKTWLAPQYAAEVRQLLGEAAAGKERFQILRSFVVDWARFQALDQSILRLKLQHSTAWRTEWIRELAASLD